MEHNSASEKTNDAFEHARSKDGQTDPGFISKVRSDKLYRLRLMNTGYVVWMYLTLNSSGDVVDIRRWNALTPNVYNIPGIVPDTFRESHYGRTAYLQQLQGWNAAVTGSTFPDIRLIIKKDLDTASWMFTVFSIGYMTGAIVFGNLYDRFNRWLILSIAPIANAVLFAIIPWCENFAVFLALVFFNGVFSGGIDVGGNTHIAAMWGRNTAPYMQAIHFGYSFGGILSPLSAQPFVAEKQCLVVQNSTLTLHGHTEQPSNSTYMSPDFLTTTYNMTTVSMDSLDNCETFYGETRVHFAYLIAAFISLTASVPYVLSIIYHRKYQKRLDVKNNDSEEKKDSRSTLPDLSFKKKLLFVSMLMVLISLYASTENRHMALLSSFVIDFLDWTKADSLRVTSLFWGSFAAGRFISIGVAKLLKPTTMIIVYLLSLTASFLGFLIAAKLEFTALIWVFTATSGVSTSAVYPSIFTWTAESILTVTGKIAATYSVGVSIFNSVIPLVYGYLMEHVDIVFFTYLLVGQSTLCFILFIIIRILANIFVKPMRKLNGVRYKNVH